MSIRRFPRARDRHGRGVRGPLTAPDLPLSRSRADAFDELVLDAVEHLERRWATELATVEFAVEPVPPDDEPSPDGDPVALSRLEAPVPAGRGQPGSPARIVLYRRPLEARGRGVDDLADLVLDVLIHDLARLLGVTPDVIDPEGHLPGD
ncbi:MAG TPA: metallopeptidase family protein [Mycobacteriales bacterium]|nr:metallopeptidase family protein [Mycobacteriales bacterium]